MSESELKPLACPFCGAALIDTTEPRTDAPWPLMRYWAHPTSNCWADDVAIDADDPEKITAWNTRPDASAIRREALEEAAKVADEYEARMALAAAKPHPVTKRENTIAICKQDAGRSIAASIRALQEPKP